MEKLKSICNLSNTKFISNISKFDIVVLKEIKEICDDSYYNSGITYLSDDRYDILKDIVIKKDKDYIDTVGSKIRDDDNKVKLPFWMGSIDKIKHDNPALMERWLTKNKADEYIIEDKLDGISCLFIFENKDIKLYTRGDGIIGSDISYLSKYFKNIPKNLKEDIIIRGEIILKNNIFNKKYKKEFANPRNMVSGIIGGKKFKDCLNDLDFIAYEIIGESLSPGLQLKKLNYLGFTTVDHRKYKKIDIEILKEDLIMRKNNSEYDIDGIVVQPNTIYIRNINGNPKYVFAFKMLLDENIVETEVENVEWNISKWGVLKPRIKIKEINIGGVNINYTSGFNAKFIYDNKINKGSVLKITRSGDVIPFIIEVVSKSKIASMPDINYKWNSTNIDIIIDKNEEKDMSEMNIKMISSTFEKLNIKFVSEKTVEKLYNEGYNTFSKIVHMSKEDLLKIKGIEDKLSTKIFDNIHESLKKATIPLLLGSSGVLGYGIGIKKINSLFEGIPNILDIYSIIDENELLEKIIEIDGFSDKTAKKIIENIENANKFINDIKDFITIKENHPIIKEDTLKDCKICFTGFRDKDLENLIVNKSGKIVTTVTKNTNILIVKNETDISSKILDAKKLNIEILNKESFIIKYINNE